MRVLDQMCCNAGTSGQSDFTLICWSTNSKFTEAFCNTPCPGSSVIGIATRGRPHDKIECNKHFTMPLTSMLNLAQCQ